MRVLFAHSLAVQNFSSIGLSTLPGRLRSGIRPLAAQIRGGNRDDLRRGLKSCRRHQRGRRPPASPRLSVQLVSEAHCNHPAVKYIGRALGFLIALTLILAVAAGVVLLVVQVIRHGSPLGAALVASGATVAAGLLVRDFERRKVADAIRREKLGEIYSKMAQVLHGRELPEQEVEEIVKGFMQECLMYASAKTLKTHREWHRSLPPFEQEWNAVEIRANSERYEAFVLAMRDDLGISNRGLGKGDLARLGIYDYDDLDEQ